MNNKVEELSTEYFQVIYSLKDIGNNIYEAQAIVFRRDTGEEIRLYFCEYDSDVENLENKIYKKLLEKFCFLAEKPVDWNSKTKKIIAQLNALENHETSFSIELEKSVNNGSFEEFIKENYGLFLNLIIEKTKQLVIDIEKLDPNERKSLLISDEDVYANPTDAWNLEDISLRTRIFKFFIKPSDEEIELHTTHVDRFKK
jgi:hypothetical protein